MESIFTTQTYVIGFLLIAAGGGFLFWQRQQRLLALEATAVSHTPFIDSVARTSSAAMFPADLPAKLEWKRFEELVEAYYSKTGVVAVRTKTGPASAVHIKISWKGEPRPFACVQCIAHPTGLMDVKAIHDLFAVLSAEDIRRGYVVSTGKFNVAARDLAEEKHITLMTGDIFLEKLNVLPESARAELIQEFSAGDYPTPSCPKCEAKMVRSSDDPAVWRCKTHAEMKIPAWK
ncbi:MAG: restriction endonuclease [Opitutus sp.]|nr:restriction endonuclease [Opitutus sp.]